MSESVTLQPRLTINVFDPEALHEEAVKAYCKSGANRADAIGFLGTPEAPYLVHCLVELWAEFAPAEAGYEFVNFE